MCVIDMLIGNITGTLWYDESTNLIRYGFRRPEEYLGALVFVIILIIKQTGKMK